MLRRQQHHPQFVSTSNQAEIITHIPAEENTERQLYNEELIQHITALTEKLTPKQKLVFTLWDLEELPPEEIRIITGMSSAKIKSNLYLARKYIRQRLSKN